jgi:hypothetical protein
MFVKYSTQRNKMPTGKCHYIQKHTNVIEMI